MSGRIRGRAIISNPYTEEVDDDDDQSERYKADGEL